MSSTGPTTTTPRNGRIEPADGLTACPICAAPAERVADRFPGYQEPQTFAIAHCPTCDTSFVERDGTWDVGPIYEAIYEQSSVVPGYERYRRHHQAVLKARDPMTYLSEVADDYWAIDRYLERRFRGVPTSPRILEVGSGLGYLTFALVRRGYDVRGIDLSACAVALAIEAFGPHFEALDVHDLAQRGTARYDVVIMNELIEHLIDPVEILDVTTELLARDGELVVTTPNKAYYGAEAIWETELPPVHLWWFSESSFRFLADRQGWALRFLDFADYNRRHFSLPPGAALQREPILDREGRVRTSQRVSPARYRLMARARELGVTGWVRGLQARLATRLVGVQRRRPIVCAILHPRAKPGERGRSSAEVRE